METYNIAAALIAMANLQPHALAIAIPEKNRLDKNGMPRYKKVSFKELAFETACVARGLLAAGFERGDRVVMMVPPGLNFFILAFSMLQTGIVPVFIDPGIGMTNLKTCIAETEPAGFIGISKAHIARVLMSWGKKTIHKTVTIGPRLFWGGKKMQSLRNFDRSSKPVPVFDAGPDDIAAIIFTSGSTGLSKGVVYSHGNFKAQLRMIRDTFGFSPGEI
ncbi:MAG: AMP-binding protein, partial [Chitinophagales bacterium]